MEKYLISTEDYPTYAFYQSQFQRLVDAGAIDNAPLELSKLKSIVNLDKKSFLKLTYSLPYIDNAITKRIKCLEVPDKLQLEKQTEAVKEFENTIFVHFLITTRPLKIEREEYLEAASKLLKQSDDHILRISFIDKHTLNIQSNQTLEFKTILKLQQLFYQIIKEYTNENIKDTIDFLNAIATNDLNTANEILIAKLGSKIIKSRMLDGQLKVFNNQHQRVINELKDKQQDLQDTLENYRQTYARKLQKYNEVNELLLYYENNPSTTDTTILKKYLEVNPYIQNIAVLNNTTLAFYYEAPILYYSKTIVKNLKNKTTVQIKQDIYDIFLNDRFQLYTRCSLTLEIDRFLIEASSVGNNNEFYRHPHIDSYRCFGNHLDTIKQWAKNKDYIGVLEQMSAMVLNLNFTDGIVIGDLIENIKHYPDIPSFYDKQTETFVSFNEILKIKEEENNAALETERE
jgi:hypothetical protein